METDLLFTGWDWASASHAVAILDPAGGVVDRCVFEHTEHDLDTILARLARHGNPADLPVAIERSDGLVVDRLLAAGIPSSRSTLERSMPPGLARVPPAGAKTDPGDCYRLADYLRTRRPCLRRLQPPDAVTRELQALVRLRDDQVTAKVTVQGVSLRLA